MRVDELAQIMDFGLMMPPALAIDDEVNATGKVLSVAEITKMLEGA